MAARARQRGAWGGTSIRIDGKRRTRASCAIAGGQEEQAAEEQEEEEALAVLVPIPILCSGRLCRGAVAMRYWTLTQAMQCSAADAQL